MKKAGSFFLGICLLMETGLASAQTPNVINQHFAALQQHNIKAIADGYADDAQVFSPNWQGAKSGKAGITEVYTRYFASSADLSYQITNVINAGDNIIVEYTSSGTMSKPEDVSAAYMTGKKYTLNYCAIFSIKNGLIVKETDYFDQVAFLRQVGFFEQH